MSNTLILNQPRVDVGLQAATYTVPSGLGGFYYVSFQCTEIPPSGLSVVVNQNGSPVFTAPAVGQTQSALQFRYAQVYAAADVITVVVSSSNANDNLLNSVQSEVAIGQGM
jgi:hypothetical protein